jgi:hypothetical protein
MENDTKNRLADMQDTLSRDQTNAEVAAKAVESYIPFSPYGRETGIAQKKAAYDKENPKPSYQYI